MPSQGDLNPKGGVITVGEVEVENENEAETIPHEVTSGTRLMLTTTGIASITMSTVMIQDIEVVSLQLKILIVPIIPIIRHHKRMIEWRAQILDTTIVLVEITTCMVYLHSEKNSSLDRLP